MMSTSGETVTLASLRGTPFLLAFFPFAFSSTCTEEFCEMTERYADFAETGVTVFPVSVDSKYALKEFKAKYNMPVELLSDFDRRTSAAYGTLWHDKGFSNRAYFLIDRDGIVRWAHVEANPGMKRENAEILEQIAKLT